LLKVAEVDVAPELSAPRWNIAPQAPVLAVTEPHDDPGQRRLSVFKWGLVPFWAKDPSIGARAFNARAETVLDKAMFRGAVETHRCVLPADAFYEWAPAPARQPSRRKQPWCFKAPGTGLLLLGGLFERWRPRGDPKAEPLWTCTVLTTEANSLVEPVHDRMPVLIGEEDLTEWLAREPLPAGELERLVRPAPPETLEAYRVSSLVNDAREDGPDLMREVALADGPGEPADRLF
jgi:putative SOS response-associated peptidase YedK